MKAIISFMKKQNQLHLVLMTLIVLFVVSDIAIPHSLASVIDSSVGNIVVVVIALAMLLNEKPVIGVLSVIAAYELIKRSSVKTGTHGIRKYLPSEDKKGSHYSALNDFAVTLEEEQVQKMVPFVVDNSLTGPSYKPVLNASHNATNI